MLYNASSLRFTPIVSAQRCMPSTTLLQTSPSRSSVERLNSPKSERADCTVRTNSRTAALNHDGWLAEPLGSAILYICRNFSLELALDPNIIYRVRGWLS